MNTNAVTFVPEPHNLRPNPCQPKLRNLYGRKRFEVRDSGEVYLARAKSGGSRTRIGRITDGRLILQLAGIGKAWLRADIAETMAKYAAEWFDVETVDRVDRRAEDDRRLEARLF